jgi:anti-sigma B factor antagonist
MFRLFKRRKRAVSARRADPGPRTSPESVAPASFFVRTESIDGQRYVVAVTGELDVSTVPRLRSALDDAIVSGHTRIVVDLERTSFVDSSSLAVLVATFKRLRSFDGALTIVSTDPALAKMLTMTGFDALLTVHATRTEALAAV